MPDLRFPGADTLDLSTSRRIHIIGVGGAGMSAIALILRTMGHQVTGVDVTETGVWPQLQAAGIESTVVDRTELFDLDAGTPPEIVAHSTAFPPGADTVEAAADRGTAIVSRAVILGAICRTRRTVAVSGTHGKTSTTALLATLLDGAAADPSYLVGATPVSLGRAAWWGGDGGAFVVEADESDGSFLALGADIAVVTNVDEDHLDFWGSLDAIEAGFDRFLGEARLGVVCTDSAAASGGVDERARRLAAAHDAVTVGESGDVRWQLHDVQVDRLTTTFGLRHDGVECGPVRIGTPGRHHARNAAVAVAVADLLGIPASVAVPALEPYSGVARRFEVLGTASGVTVVDDYAHNPGKVRAVVSSALDAGWGRVIVVFQPHRHTRTRDQGADFGEALAGADLVAVLPIYGAGEDPLPGVSSQIVVDAVRASRADAEVHAPTDPADAVAWLSTQVRADDLVLTVGAGDVYRVGHLLLESLGVRSSR